MGSNFRVWHSPNAQNHYQVVPKRFPGVDEVLNYLKGSIGLGKENSRYQSFVCFRVGKNSQSSGLIHNPDVV